MPRGPSTAKQPLALVPQGERSLPVPAAASAAHVLQAAASSALRGVRTVVATVLERHGSAPGTPGQKLLLGADGTCLGTVGGGAVEREVLGALVEMLGARDVRHRVRSFELGAELGMCCGGRLEVLLEPIEALVPCLVVGGGHVATAVAPMLARIGFAVTVVDPREAWSEEDRLPGVRVVRGDHDDTDVDPSGACLVMTHDHALDQQAIEWALRKKFAFVGGLGSRAKAVRTRQRLEAKGFAASDRERVRMPLGLDVGARLPDEIAVAIAGELLAWRKQR